MKVTDPISSPSQHVVQTKNPRMENLRNQKWETSYKKATSTCHFILRQIRSHSLCFPRHECRIWVLWNWLACFPCPRCIFIRRNFRTGNFNTNRSLITGDVKYGIKIPNMSCFLFIILASGHFCDLPIISQWAKNQLRYIYFSASIFEWNHIV